MSNDNLRIMGFGNPLLDISAVVEQGVLDECVLHTSSQPAAQRHDRAGSKLIRE